MSLLVNLTDAIVESKEDEIEGKTTTRPRLYIGDEALNQMYVVNVDIGEDEEMKDVAIAAGNNELRYCEVGSPVQLKKVSGHWTVVGFAKTMPGLFKRVPVDVPIFEFGVPTYTIGTEEIVSFEVRALTYGELGVYGSYGAITTPYGALGKFQGGTLIEVFT